MYATLVSAHGPDRDPQFRSKLLLTHFQGFPESFCQIDHEFSEKAVDFLLALAHTSASTACTGSGSSLNIHWSALYSCLHRHGPHRRLSMKCYARSGKTSHAKSRSRILRARVPTSTPYSSTPSAALTNTPAFSKMLCPQSDLWSDKGIMRALPFLFLAAAVSLPAQDLKTFVNSQVPGLVTIYKDLHAHPELSHQEAHTSALVADELRKAGYTVTERVGKY